MFLVGIDESWWKSPFFRHNRLLDNQKDVTLLRKSDIKEVLIDPSRGLDVASDELILSVEDSDQEDSYEPERDQCHLPERPTEVLDVQSSTDHSSLDTAQRVRDDAIHAVESIFEGVKTGDVINQPKLQQTVEALLNQVLSEGAVMVDAILIQNLRTFDKALYGHVVDVAVLSIMVGIQLDLDEESLLHVALGGLLHDVGHVRIPRNILRRRHNLFVEDEAVFKRHVELGLAVLESCPTIPPAVQRVVTEHHERQDGSGYPNRLEGNGIALVSEVVGFVDHFDSLVSPWGPPPCLPTAMAIRKLYQEAQSGTVRTKPVEALIRCLGVYPIGSFVSLSTGERAIVLKPNTNAPLKPTVKIIFDSLGKRCAMPMVEDLSMPHSSTGEREVLSVLDPAKYKVDVGKYF